MNHELHIILMHLKQRTYNNTNLCREILYRYKKCHGIGCKYCVLNTCSVTSDQYVSRLIFRVPI